MTNARGAKGSKVLAVAASLAALVLASGAGCGGVVTMDGPPTGTAETATPTTATPTATPITATIWPPPPTATPVTATGTLTATNTPLANTAITNIAVNTATTNTMPINTPTTGISNTPMANTPMANTPITGGVTTNTPAVPSNYIDDGTIHGYCFGFQTVSGMEAECSVASGLCCPYSLPGTSWEDIAMVGCNVNQPVEGGFGSEGVWVPRGSAICVEGRGFQRIQIQGPRGASDANDRWCATVPPGGGCVPWSEFNTTCWDNAGYYYANEPLQVVAALQPSLSDGVDVAVTPVSDTLCVFAMYVLP